MYMYKKDDYNFMANRRINAFMEIARKLGKDHTITKMMGSLAWGRHKAEQGIERNLHSAILEVSYLDGYFDCLSLWTRDNDRDAQRIILNIYPRGFESKK